MDRERFDRIVRNKVVIGEPFTLEDVAETGKCQHPILPGCDCVASPVPTAWITPLVQAGVVRKVGEIPSKSPGARGRKISLWGGSAPRLDEVDEVA